jgi:hypothetical protein
MPNIEALKAEARGLGVVVRLTDGVPELQERITNAKARLAAILAREAEDARRLAEWSEYERHQAELRRDLGE